MDLHCISERKFQEVGEFPDLGLQPQHQAPNSSRNAGSGANPAEITVKLRRRRVPHPPQIHKSDLRSRQCLHLRTNGSQIVYPSAALSARKDRETQTRPALPT